MENPQDLNQLVKQLKKLQRLHEQELARIEPIIRQAMALGIQDLDYFEGHLTHIAVFLPKNKNFEQN